MIDSISAILSKPLPQLMPHLAADEIETPGLLPGIAPAALRPPGEDFGELLGEAINGVNAKLQTAEVEKARVMSGETNNLHQAMLSMQEAGVAFSLMTEVRNKLVDSYQEIMRMQV